MATAGSWKSLRKTTLSAPIISALTDTLCFPHMTPVQAAAIAPLLSSKDVCVQAETGSGKTLSYLVPIAETILFRLQAKPSYAIRALVLLPTRELAKQVLEVARGLFQALPGELTVAELIGGAGADVMPAEEMRKDLRVVIATPGRLAAAVVSGGLDVTDLEMLVLDEADRLLDMGFAVTVTDILTRLPKQRRTGIYSATQTKELDALARAGMRNPVRVTVKVHVGGKDGEERRRIPISLKCQYAVVSPRDKLAHFLGLLADEPHSKFIVYFMTCAFIDYMKRLPLQEMWRKISGKSGKEERKFFALHGKLSQKKRDRALQGFAESENAVLMCTDVAARGIDIPDVDWVVQMDPPQDPDAYIHRVGRTARLGREGTALIYITPSEDAYIEFLKVRKCPVEQMSTEETSKVDTERRTLVQEMVLKATLADRAILEASEAAFLSFVRAYKEHKCSYLLKLEEMDINSVADSFSLLRFPRFYEFKKFRKTISPRNVTGVSIRDIAFRDKVREKKRQKDISHAIATRAERRDTLDAKRKKKRKRRQSKKGDQQETLNKKKQKTLDEEEEEEDFGAAAAKLRKVKRGKLSESAFDEETGITLALNDAA